MNDSRALRGEPMSPLLRLAAAAGPVVAAWAIAGLATAPGTEWYRDLPQPSFAPPGWVFAPVWTLLYLAMIAVAWRLLGLEPSRERSRALALFYGQLVLNALWSVAFFTFQSPVAGLVVLAALTACVLAAIRVFAPLDRTSSLLFTPYAAWVVFASALNLGIVVLAASG
ncbi:MAG: tryptophan-rich sensory protein [Microvirga sp.]|nr:tryptophan-rich sensory protein [Microvirga sp.]